jgi:hypothetical protein
MRGVKGLLCALLGAAACVPRAQPAQPTQPVIADTRPLTPFPAANTPARSETSHDPTLFAQPQPPQPPQQPSPYPQPQPQPYQPQPYPQPQPQPQPYPQPQPQPYPPQPQPYQPQPYPQPGQPQPYPQPYQPQPQPYPQPGQPQPPYGTPYPAQPAPYPYPYPPPSRRLHNGEVIADFAAVGALASIDILVRQNVDNGGAGTLIMLAGIGGGGALGWLLTEKYTVDAGAAHSTTIGLLAGTANAALLIRPSESYDAEDVIGLLFLGSAVGAGGGFAYGQAADLTSGQSIFLGNTVLLGTATAALVGITGSRNGQYDNWENAALALGIDVGLIGGALIAPRLDWSPYRARIVFAATAIGALVGGMLPSLITKRSDDESYNGDLITGAMTAGLWGGFGLGVMMTRDKAPDAKYMNPRASAAPTARSTSYLPFVGEHGQIGLMAGGTW